MLQNDANFQVLFWTRLPEPIGCQRLRYANIASTLRLTGPAVFVNDPFGWAFCNWPTASMMSSRWLLLTSLNRFLLRLTRLAGLAFYRGPYKQSWADGEPTADPAETRIRDV